MKCKILFRKAVLFLLIFLLSGCQWLPVSEGDIKPTPTLSVVKNKNTSDSPPFIDYVFPDKNATIALSQIFKIHFTEKMNHSSVEAAVEFIPRIAGSFEWDDDQTVVFKPDQQFTINQDLIMRINKGALSDKKLELAEPETYLYQVSPSLKLTYTNPSFEISEISPVQEAFYVSFNLPVVNFDSNADDFPPAFQIEPEPKGVGKWVSSSTYAFFPDTNLIGGEDYKLLVNRQLSSLFGTILEVDQKMEWMFHTLEPEVISVLPENKDQIPLDQSFFVKFNQSMLTESTAINFRFTDLQGTPIAGRFKWNDNSTELEFKPEYPLSRGKVYLLEILPGSKTLGGGILTQKISLSYSTIQSLDILLTSPMDGQPLDLFEGNRQISIKFSAALDPSLIIENFVKVYPEVKDLNFTFSHDQQTLFLNGDFQSGVAYQVFCSEGISDKWGGLLENDYSFNFVVSPPTPEINLNHLFDDHTIIISPDIYKLGIDVVNLFTIQTKISKINLEEYFFLLDNPSSPIQGEVIENFQQPLTPIKNKIIHTDLLLNLEETGLREGIYAVELSSEGLEIKRFYILVNADYIFSKLSGNQIFIWLANSINLEPDIDQSITIKNNQNEVLYEGKTNLDGVLIWQFMPFDPEGNSFWIEINDSDKNTVSLLNTDWNDHSLPELFGINYINQTTEDQVFWKINKSLFFSGETMSGYGYLQKFEYGSYRSETFDTIQLLLQKITPAAEQTFSFQVPLLENGLFYFDYDISPQLPEGTYSLSIQNLNIDPETIVIQKKPISENFTLDISLSEDEYFFEDQFSATIKLNTRYGDFNKSQQFGWRIFCNLCTGKQEDWTKLTENNLDEVNLENQLLIAEGIGFFDQLGLSMVDFSLENLNNFPLNKSQPQELILEIYLKDLDQVVTFNSKTFIVFPERSKIEIEVDPFVIVPEEVIVQFLTKNWKDNPIGAITFNVKFQKLLSLNGEYPVKNQWIDLFQTSLKSDGNGTASIPVYPNGPGIYQVEVKNKIFSEKKVFFVSGSGLAEYPLDAFGQLPLMLNLDQSQKNGTVQLFIPNPFSEPARAYVTIEQSSVLDYMFFEINNGQEILDLNFRPSEKDQFFISVVLIARDSHAMVQGYVSDRINQEFSQVLIQSNTDETNPNLLNISVLDNSNHGIQSHVIIEVVSKEKTISIEDLQQFKQIFTNNDKIGVLTAGIIKNENAVFLGSTKFDEPTSSMIENPKFENNYSKRIFLSTDDDGQLILDLDQYGIDPNTDLLILYAVHEGVQIGSGYISLAGLETVFTKYISPEKIFSTDEFNFSIEISNPTQFVQKSELNVNFDGLQIINQPVENIIILSPNEKITLSWTLKGLSNKKASIQSQLIIANQVVEDNYLDIIVLPKKKVIKKIATGKLAEKDVAPYVFYLSEETFTDAKLSIGAFPTLTGILLPASDQLIDSVQSLEEKSLSLLALTEIYKLQNKIGDDLKNNFSELENLIDTIVEAQNSDGGWGITPNQPSDMEVTLITVWALMNYQSNFQPVPEANLLKAQEYISTNLISLETMDETYACDLLAWQYYDLSLFNSVNIDPLTLLQTADKCSIVGKILISSGINQTWPGDQRGRNLLLGLIDELIVDESGSHIQQNDVRLRLFADSYSATALLTHALSIQDPANLILDDLVETLFNHQINLYTWQTPVQTALVLTSFSSFIDGRGISGGNTQARVILNNTDVIELSPPYVSFQNGVESQIEGNGLNSGFENQLSFEVKNDSSSPLYYFATLEEEQSLGALISPNKVSINRYVVNNQQNSLCDNDMVCKLSEVNLFKLNHPQVIVIQMTVFEAIDHFYFSEQLPAGFRKIDHPNFYENSSELIYSPLVNMDETWINLSENSDSEIDYYAKTVSPGSYYFIYTIIPEFSGSYYWPAVEVFSLSDASVSCGQFGQSIIIK